MLTRFSVENFKNFKDKLVWNLLDSSDFDFNEEIINNNCITKGLILGVNGSGKSNLGLALFDIIFHITDKQKLISKYNYYLNLDSSKSYATFEYIFSFNGKEVIYQYKKKDVNTLLEEYLYIDKERVVFYDFINNKGNTTLRGAETLNMVSDKNLISRVKYIKSNAILEENEINQVFYQFVEFIEHMLLFYSLDERGYQGLYVGGESISQGIIESGHVEKFEKFLHKNGIDYQLVSKEIDEKKILYCKFRNGEANFFSIASTGTVSLALLYYWYIKMSSASFVFIDEFDAFYHFELAWNIVELIKELYNSQVFLSTHNTDLISNDLMRPDCYFILEKNEIKNMYSSTERELRKAHNLQKMYKAGLFYE